MPMNLGEHGRLRVAVVLLLTLSLQFSSSQSAWAVVGDKADVSPGKIPPAEKDHYLGNSSVTVRLEYPRSFILQETVGDLRFTVTLAAVPGQIRRRIDIYIPPEFKVNTGSSYVWTNVTNDYANIEMTKAGSYDNVAPNWYKVSVTSPMMRPGNYSIRVFDVTAPSIVGLYFFKVFTNQTSIGAKNFPSIVVSADPNPAYVSGTVKYGGKMPVPGYVYGNPIFLDGKRGEGGKVCATGITSEGRIVIGQAFFNASANYTLYGLAPGRYTLNATAAGYAPGELPYPISPKAGQSLEGIDIFLEHSSVTTIVALSRWMKQPAIWGDLRNGTMLVPINKTITLEIFDLWNTTNIRLIGLVNHTVGSKKTSHIFEYRGEKDWDGHIPQENASYVGGIGPGRYFFRVWVNGYVQPSAANEWVWRNECAVDYSRNEQNRRINIPLEKTGTLKVIVHFTNSTRTLGEATTGQNGTLTVEAYNLVEEKRASNSTFVGAGNRAASVELTGLFNTTRAYGLPPGEYIVFARWTLQTRSDALRLYSLGPGYVSFGNVYLSSAYRYGPTGHRVTIGEGLNEISFYVVLQGGLNLTVFPITWQKPFNITTWKYPESAISVEIRDKYGVESYGSYRLKQENKNGQPVNNTASVIGLDDGIYSIYIFTYGYIQERVVFFSVRKGEMADISVYVVSGGAIKITLVFQKQKMLSPIDTYVKYWNSSNPKVPVRFEIYDSRAQFVGAAATYIPDAGTKMSFSSFNAGFRSYYGNASTRWVNYYDTTDRSLQRDYGLGSDWYTLKVYVPGYWQKSDPVIEVRRGGETSVIIVLERMGHLWGKVRTFNTYFGNYTRISWVSIDILGGDIPLRTCSLDGFYEAWVNPGSYLVMYSLPGYQTISLKLPIPDGSDVQRDLQLLPFGTSARASMSVSAGSSMPIFPLRTVASRVRQMPTRE